MSRRCLRCPARLQQNKLVDLKIVGLKREKYIIDWYRNSCSVFLDSMIKYYL